MPETTGRFAAGLLVLVALWIGTYWLWPAKASRIRLDPGAATPTAAPAPTAGTPTPSSASRPLVAPPPVSQLHSAQTEPKPDPKPDPKPEPKAQPKPLAVVPPVFLDYTIKDGDTLASISQRHYGSTAHADAIRRANPLASLDKLKVGRVIKIPKDPANIQGLPVATAPPQSEPPATPREVVKVAPPTPTPTPSLVPGDHKGPRDYVVQSGDSLSKIAEKLLGDQKHADLIFEANRDTLANPNSLRVGQTLRIPAKPID